MVPEASGAVRPSQSNSYLARHWRGEMTLPRSYWINGVLIFGFGINLLVAAIAFAAAVALANSGAVVVLIVATSLALNVAGYIWALVGTLAVGRKVYRTEILVDPGADRHGAGRAGQHRPHRLEPRLPGLARRLKRRPPRYDGRVTSEDWPGVIARVRRALAAEAQG